MKFSEVMEEYKNPSMKFDSSPFSSCSDCTKNSIVCTTLRMHLLKDHSVSEVEVDELVLKRWIKLKLLNQKNITLKLICPWCHDDFKEFHEYYDHLYIQHLYPGYEKYCELVNTSMKGNIVCPICKNIFKSVLCLNNHIEAVHSEVPYLTCLLCQDNCMGKGALLRHINHHISGIQKCPICSCRYSTQRQFSSHLEFFHTNKYFVKCTQCSSSFSSYTCYEMHKNTEHSLVNEITNPLIQSLEVNNLNKDEILSKKESFESNIILCEKCNVGFDFKSQYERHLYNSHPSCFKYRCEECECLFKVYGDFISHQMSHFIGFHHCPHCNAKFSKVDQIKKHLRFSHPFVKGLECKLCVKNFKSYDTYLNHLKLKHPEVSGEALKDTQCDVCQKKFVNSYQLHLHAKNHQKETGICTVCEKAVKNLSSHMNLHTKVQTFRCNSCDIICNSKSSLILHCKRTHLGESVKKHNCKECGKKFVCKSDLDIHTSGVHLGIRKFKCSYCAKAYKNKVSLLYHERKHTGYKPHGCTLCEKSFATPTSIKQHMEKEHKAIFKGIYCQQNSQSHIDKEAKPKYIVHINVPMDMRKEEVSSWDHGQLHDEKVLSID